MYGEGFQAEPDETPGRIAKGALPAGPDASQYDLDAERFQEGTPALPKPTTIYGEGFTATDPSEAQVEAGNYNKRKVRFQGLPISIETEAGQTRSGTGADGKRWSVEMPTPYGYLKRTEGADGEQVDVYLGSNGSAPTVYVVDQIDPETGLVQIVAYASVNDIGRIVSPTIVRGQIEGGAVQGIGQALCEQVLHDRESGQLLTGSLMDYALPRAGIVGSFRTVLDPGTPCLTNPLGVKGVGELGTIGATPAVVNAVVDALSRAGAGERALQLQMPLLPERVWRALHGVA